MSVESAKKAIRKAQAQAVRCFEVPNELLPERYHRKRSHRNLASVAKECMRRRKNLWKEGRDVSVKFDNDRNITSARQERLAIIEKYQRRTRSDRAADAGNELFAPFQRYVREKEARHHTAVFTAPRQRIGVGNPGRYISRVTSFQCMFRQHG